jgi:hypothetical protein
MSRLTLRLPDSLHVLLQNQSVRDGLSLNQYIIYALTQHTTAEYLIEAVPEKEASAQRARFNALLQTMGQPADNALMDRIFASREKRGKRSAKLSAAKRTKLKKAMAHRAKVA